MENKNKTVWTQFRHVGEIIDEVWNRVDASHGKTCPVKESHDNSFFDWNSLETEVIG